MLDIDKKQRIDYFLLSRGQFLWTQSEFSINSDLPFADFSFKKRPNDPILLEYVEDCFDVLECDISHHHEPIYFFDRGFTKEITRRVFSEVNIKIRVYGYETINYILKEIQPLQP